MAVRGSCITALLGALALLATSHGAWAGEPSKREWRPPTEPPAATASDSEEAPRQPSTFKVHTAVDVPVLLTGFMLLAIPPLVTPELSPPHCGSSTTEPCDPENLNPLDRLAIDNNGTTSATISDILLFGMPAVAAGIYGLADGLAFGWKAWGEDIVIMGEVATISGGLQQLMSLAVRRPRPYMYTPELRTQEERDKPSASQSFFSGHASTAFGIATSLAYIITNRHPNMDHKWLVWVGALAVAAPMPFLRVNAGSHFWTDTITGAVVGVGTGLIVPYLHEETPELGGVALRPFAGSNGVGLAGDF